VYKFIYLLSYLLSYLFNNRSLFFSELNILPMQ